MANFSGEQGEFQNDRIRLQDELFPVRIRGKMYPPNGADIAFTAHGFDGDFYYCKDDRNGRPVRMIEAFCANLARHLGISVPHLSCMEDEESQQTVLGSLRHISTAEDWQLSKLIRTPSKDELGRRWEWLGRYFSALLAFDLFLNNSDRSQANLLLHTEGTAMRLCAIDFAASDLRFEKPELFPIATSNTVVVGKKLTATHGFYPESAIEMIERIRLVPMSKIEQIVRSLPEEWVSLGVKEQLYDFWSGKNLNLRADSLRAVLEDGIFA